MTYLDIDINARVCITDTNLDKRSFSKPSFDTFLLKLKEVDWFSFSEKCNDDSDPDNDVQ